MIDRLGRPSFPTNLRQCKSTKCWYITIDPPRALSVSGTHMTIIPLIESRRTARCRGATFLEAIGAVKTERREYESLLLLNALFKREPIPRKNQERMSEFAKRNKVQ